MLNPLLIQFRLIAKSNPMFRDHREDWEWTWATDFYGGWLDVVEGEWHPEDYAYLNAQIEQGLLRSYAVVRRFDRDHFFL